MKDLRTEKKDQRTHKRLRVDKKEVRTDKKEVRTDKKEVRTEFKELKTEHETAVTDGLFPVSSESQPPVSLPSLTAPARRPWRKRLRKFGRDFIAYLISG